MTTTADETLATLAQRIAEHLSYSGSGKTWRYTQVAEDEGCVTIRVRVPGGRFLRITVEEVMSL